MGYNDIPEQHTLYCWKTTWKQVTLLQYGTCQINQWGDEQAITTVSCDIEGWDIHQCMIKNLVNNTEGSPDNATVTPSQICKGCKKGKSKRLPFPPSKSRATQLLDFFHSDDEPAHQILLYTLLFSLFHYFLYIADSPLPTPCQHDCTQCIHTHLCFIRPASLIWWTDFLQFTCFMSILSSPTCTLLQPDQSQILTPRGQALTIASLQMSLVLAFLFTICI